MSKTTMSKTRGTGLLMVWSDIEAEFNRMPLLEEARNSSPCTSLKIASQKLPGPVPARIFRCYVEKLVGDLHAPDKPAGSDLGAPRSSTSCCRGAPLLNDNPAPGGTQGSHETRHRRGRPTRMKPIRSAGSAGITTRSKLAAPPFITPSACIPRLPAAGPTGSWCSKRIP
jgi:hypothetical protein